MKRGKIAINLNGMVAITIGEKNTVWLSQWQLADLFDVFTAKINANVRSILKSGVLAESEVVMVQPLDNGGSVDLYNMEMVAALSFRIQSDNARIFRRWLHRKVLVAKQEQPIIIQWNDKMYLC